MGIGAGTAAQALAMDVGFQKSRLTARPTPIPKMKNI